MKIRLFLGFILCSIVLLPSEVTGLRKYKPGDKLPFTGPLTFLKMEKNLGNAPLNKLIFYYKSGDTRSKAFLKSLKKILKQRKKDSNRLVLYLVDGETGSSTGPEMIKQKIEGVDTNRLIRLKDAERVIYGQLGIIVIPTLIFVKPDNTMHSLIAGMRHNRELFIRGYLDSLLSGKNPENLYDLADKDIASRKTAKMLKQAFMMMIDHNYALAGSIYRKALKGDSQKGEALLGAGYALMMAEKYREALDYFGQLKSQSNTSESLNGQFQKRLLLGYWLSSALTASTPQALEKVGRYAMMEPNFFMVIHTAANLLEGAGEYELSSKIHHRAYTVLLRKIRRSKTK